MRDDLLICGARLVGGSGAPVDVTIANGVIGAVAPSAATAQAPPAGAVRIAHRTGTAQPNTPQTIAADGRWLMPGLWDSHVHPTDWAAARHRLDLSQMRSTTHIVEAVTARLDSMCTGPREVIGAGLWCASWPHRPTAADLDEGFAGIPVTLVLGDSHSALFNAAAQAKYGVTDVADQGWVSEGAWFEVMPHLSSADDATRDQWVIEAGRDAAARGIVGIVDLDPHDTHVAWQRRHSAGFDAHRVKAGVWMDYLDAAIAAGLRTGDPVPGAGPLVTMGPFKVIADGSLNSRTAFCHHPFDGGGHGGMNIDIETLTLTMARAAAHGIESTIHAIGDAALARVLDAFAASGAPGSIEHAQLACERDITRMADLGLAASVQPWHLVDDRDLAERLWPERTDRAYAYADMVRCGVELRLGSDAPVAPLDPWLAIQAAVTRTGDDRPAWHPEQALTLEQAVRASWGGVQQVAAGGPADVVLLERNPLAMDPAALDSSIGVAATVCAGNVTHLTL